MAGIGFELKKIFAQKGVLNSVKAYGYAAVICTGPMLFGILMLLGITGLCMLSDTDISIRETLISMITHTLLASTLISSVFSSVVTRFIADKLFEDNKGAVLSVFWGSTVIMMAIGDVLYGAFLLISGATFLQWILCFTLFGELIIVWNAMNFLSAIKDYKGIFLSFLTAVLTSVLVGALMLALGLPVLESLLFAVGVGYGVMLVWDVVLLHRYFPNTKESAFAFLRWMDDYLPLALSGLFMAVGMFSHLLIMWYSDIGVQTSGLFYSAPWYDVPALLAFLTSVITTINFVVSVEVNFYPKYRTHYSLYNDRGTIDNIKQAEREMIGTLRTELFYSALKQLLFTVLVISLGGYLLDLLPLGFNEIMRGYFRTLCVAYGICAVGNMMMLILLYFTDYKGAVAVTAAFAASTVAFTLISLLFPNVYYGFGFLIAAVIFSIAGALRMDYFTKRLPYYILSVQPLVKEEKVGTFEKVGNFLKRKLEEDKKENENEE